MLIEYGAKYLSDLCLTPVINGGIYLTGSVFNKGMRFAFEDPELRDKFLEKFQNRGAMAEMLKRIPITLVLRGDIALLGCLHYAKEMLLK